MKTFKEYLNENTKTIEQKILKDAKKNDSYFGYAYAILEYNNYHSENKDILEKLGMSPNDVDYKKVNFDLISDYSSSVDYEPETKFVYSLIEKAIGKKAEKIKDILI